MNINKNAGVHFRVEVISHAWLRYHVIVLIRFGCSKKVVVWIQFLVLQAVNSNNRVYDVDWDPVQRRYFVERFISKLGWIKNLLVVAKVEKLVFHPLAHFCFRLTSLSNCWIALFEVQLECLGNVRLKVSQKLCRLFQTTQALNSFLDYCSLIWYCIVKSLVSLLLVRIKTEIS
jgi:hypothetical protein